MKSTPITSSRVLKLCALLAASAAVTPAMADVFCSVGATGVVFGTYNPASATPLNSSGQILVTCTLEPKAEAANVGYTVALSAGSSGSMTSRAMFSGANFLVYNLYTTSGYTQIWGNGAAGSAVVTGSIKLGRSTGDYSGTRAHTVHGRIPAIQDVLPGNYVDTIVVTVTY